MHICDESGEERKLHSFYMPAKSQSHRLREAEFIQTRWQIQQHQCFTIKLLKHNTVDLVLVNIKDKDYLKSNLQLALR